MQWTLSIKVNGREPEVVKMSGGDLKTENDVRAHVAELSAMGEQCYGYIPTEIISIEESK